MKISFILRSIGLSGGVRMVLLYADYLVDKGHEVTVYYPLSGGYHGWKKYLFPLRNIARWIADGNLRGDWYQGRFDIKHPYRINNRSIKDADIVIATSWITAFWVYGLNASKGKKVYFVQEHETWGTEHQNELCRQTYRMDYKLFLTVSSTLKDRLHKEYGKDAVVVYNGLAKDEIRDQPRNPVCGEMTVGFPYRKGIRKNIEMAIRILKKLQVKIRFKVISYGFEKADGLPAEWEYFYRPERKLLYDIYEKIDIFFVPSLYEGWGLPAVEAMAHGCAVIGHDSGSIHEVGINDVNCIVLKDMSDEELVFHSIEKLLTDKEKAYQLGESGRKAVIARLNHNEQCEEFERALIRLV